MIRNTSIQNGELVIISGVKKYLKWNVLKSLRVRILLLVLLAGVVPTLVLYEVILSSYEKREVEIRTAEIQNQCTILCNQLSDSNYLTGEISDIIRSELVQMSNIYSGRVLVIDQDFRIQEDTYDMDKGKTIVSEDVIRCFEGKGTGNYDAENQYIEVTSPVYNKGTEKVTGVMLISVSTEMIVDSMQIMAERIKVMCLATALVIVILAFVAGLIMVRPFHRINQSIAAVTEGYEDDYLHENTYTETMMISDSFNKMLGRLKVLNDSRDEFVSNVSHELKTPDRKSVV